VCGRATIRDLYEPQQGARVMSHAMSGLGLIAVLAPMLGGALAGWWGWRAALASLAAIGAGVLCFVLLALPETVRQRNPRALQLGPLRSQAAQVLRHPTFIAWTALTSSTYGGLFTVLAGSSFVYIGVLGLTPSQYGLAMASGALSYLLGTFACRRWLQRAGLRGTVKLGAFFTLAGGLSMLLFAWFGVQAVWAVLVPQWLYVFGHGIHQPCGQTGAVSPFPLAAGVAAALAGFVLALVAFGVGLWLGQTLDGTVRPMVHGLCLWSVITAVVAWTLVQRHGEPHRHPIAA
jgi:DHA1 family bicyclomycin/chloramphenicol resistance-like MFS transporter